MKIYKSQKIIGLDFDGCIAIGDEAKIAHAKNMFKIDITSEQTSKKTFPLGPENYEKLVLYCATEGTKDYKLAENCKEVLDSLSSDLNLDFVIITSRKSLPGFRQLEACIKFCKEHDLPISKYYGTNDTPKYDICSEIAPIAFIDDTASKLDPLNSLPMQLFYFQRNWNNHETVSPSYKTVNTWNEFKEKLEQIL